MTVACESAVGSSISQHTNFMIQQLGHVSKGLASFGFYFATSIFVFKTDSHIQGSLCCRSGQCPPYGRKSFSEASKAFPSVGGQCVYSQCRCKGGKRSKFLPEGKMIITVIYCIVGHITLSRNGVLLAGENGRK